MFEQTLIESNNTIQSNRGKSTIVSFIVQCIVIGVVVLIPLLFTQALPAKELTTLLVAPPPPPPPPPPAASAPVKHAAVKVEDTSALKTPTSIPKQVTMVKDQPQQVEAPPSAVAGVVGGVPGGVAGGQPGGVLGGVLSSTPAYVPPKPNVQRVRVSQGVTQGLLTKKVQPEYPALARQARIQGSVVLRALISKTGQIENLQVVSGHPMLTSSAIQAVKQWQYKPYILNGQPVEVETNITVNFTLAGT
jgi:periplasmic protein TonB